jgi:hypothetical protein
MEEITRILLKIIKLMQILILLGSAISFIYLGILTYLKKIEEIKRNLPLILIGLAILFSAYSVPVLLLSFLEKKELERLAYFQSNPPSFPQVEVTSHANPDIYIPEPNILQPESEPQQAAQSTPPINTIDTKKECEDKALQIGVKESKLFLKDIIKRGYVTGYIIPYGGIDFLICIVGRPIVRDTFYGENGELRHQLNWIAGRLYKIKQKVPTLKNQPAWFTVVFILDSQFKNDPGYKNTEEGKTLEGLCQGAKAFFIVQQNRSIFFYCYNGKEAEEKI